jgi:hypothetical protein
MPKRPALTTRKARNEPPATVPAARVGDVDDLADVSEAAAMRQRQAAARCYRSPRKPKALEK